MNRTLLYRGGALAPVLYFGTVVAGGLMQPAHSHLAVPVSLLGAPGAPGAALVAAGWAVTGLMVAGLGLALAGDRYGPGWLAGGLVLVTGLCMAAIALAFPMDPAGAPLSRTGIAHIVLVSGSGLTLLAAILLSLWRARSPAERRGSALAVAVMLAGGALAGVAALASWPLAGLGEIITQAGYHLWFLGMALAGLQRTRTGSVA